MSCYATDIDHRGSYWWQSSSRYIVQRPHDTLQQTTFLHLSTARAILAVALGWEWWPRRNEHNQHTGFPTLWLAMWTRLRRDVLCDRGQYVDCWSIISLAICVRKCLKGLTVTMHSTVVDRMCLVISSSHIKAKASSDLICDLWACANDWERSVWLYTNMPFSLKKLPMTSAVLYKMFDQYVFD